MNNDANIDQLELRYVDLHTVGQWDKNPKLHDMGSIISSIKRYGFKDPIKFEPTLNNGKGGIVAGNGRLSALTFMQRDDPAHPPRGIIRDPKTNTWFVPVLFGVDAASQQQAEAYGIDHNNLTMMGGNFTTLDMSRMWDADTYNDLILGLAAQDVFALSFPADEVDSVIVATTEVTGMPSIGFATFNQSAADMQTGDFVQFRFGAYKGLVSRQAYEEFGKAFEKIKKTTSNIMMDDVIREWLNGKGKGK